MDNCANILDENIIKTNVNFAALFVMNYECLKDYVISQVKGFYCDDLYFEMVKQFILNLKHINKKLEHWISS